MACIFCEIVNKKRPSSILYEDSNVIVIKDIYPKAPVHLLVIPKKHIVSVNHLEIKDKTLMGEMILAAQKIAEEKNLKNYKLLINVGRESGQLVDHIHMHLMAY